MPSVPQVGARPHEHCECVVTLREALEHLRDYRPVGGEHAPWVGMKEFARDVLNVRPDDETRAPNQSSRPEGAAE